MANCLSCHGPSELQRQIDANAQAESFFWKRVVGRMRKRWEAPLQEDEMKTVIDYLNLHFTQ